MAGLRLWSGAEAHIDGLLWQGFGIGDAHGIEGFPSGEAYRLGTREPNGMISRFFLRQTIGLGGEREAVADGPLALAGRQDVARVTITVGRLASSDIFDQNAYANSPNTQFLNWGLVNNEGWDYPADAVGFTTGLAVEWNERSWTLRYGVFQEPGQQNGLTADDRYLKWPYDPSANGPSSDGQPLRAWAMMVEGEHRWTIADHPGAIRLLAFLNRADMADYAEATALLRADGLGADLSSALAYRCKYGFGLNWQQEVSANLGVFSRLGWNDDREQGWMFSDVGYTGSVGVSIKGASWHRSDDTYALAVLVNGCSIQEQRFLAAGGTGILAGDGGLDYGLEKILETYYDCAVWASVHTAIDYQLIANPAFNRNRGPVSVFGVRLHGDY
jgi:high affinity Mn2+ porin